MPVIQIHCSSVEAYLPWKCCCYVTWIAWDILFVMSSVTGNLCNKCPKQLVKQNSSCSDYFNAISGFTLNSRAPGGPVTFLPLISENFFNSQSSRIWKGKIESKQKAVHVESTTQPQSSAVRCNILICPYFPLHIKVYTNGIAFSVCPWVVQYIIQYVLPNPGDVPEWGKCLHLHVWVQYCAHENVTLV